MRDYTQDKCSQSEYISKVIFIYWSQQEKWINE